MFNSSLTSIVITYLSSSMFYFCNEHAYLYIIYLYMKCTHNQLRNAIIKTNNIK